jgi:hypothetical protein
MNDWNQSGDKEAGSLLESIFSLIFSAVALLFRFLPAIFCAYLILRGLRAYTGDLDGWNYFLVMGVMVYFIECLIFFLKGWLIAAKGKEAEHMIWGIFWVIFWVICFLYCFTLPALMVHSLVAALTGHAHITRSGDIVLWLIAVLVSYYVFYRRYALDTDSAQKWALWAYKLGRSLPRRKE